MVCKKYEKSLKIRIQKMFMNPAVLFCAIFLFTKIIIISTRRTVKYLKIGHSQRLNDLKSDLHVTKVYIQ